MRSPRAASAGPAASGATDSISWVARSSPRYPLPAPPRNRLGDLPATPPDRAARDQADRRPAASPTPRSCARRHPPLPTSKLARAIGAETGGIDGMIRSPCCSDRRTWPRLKRIADGTSIPLVERRRPKNCAHVLPVLLASRNGPSRRGQRCWPASSAASGIANASGWFTCSCPAHKDMVPSLSLKDGPHGRISFYCFANCPPALVTDKLRGWRPVDPCRRPARRPPGQPKSLWTPAPGHGGPRQETRCRSPARSANATFAPAASRCRCRRRRCDST